MWNCKKWNIFERQILKARPSLQCKLPWQIADEVPGHDHDGRCWKRRQATPHGERQGAVAATYFQAVPSCAKLFRELQQTNRTGINSVSNRIQHQHSSFIFHFHFLPDYLKSMCKEGFSNRDWANCFDSKTAQFDYSKDFFQKPAFLTVSGQPCPESRGATVATRLTIWQFISMMVNQ